MLFRLSVLPPRIELGLTVPKTAVISISPQEHAFIYTQKKHFCQREILSSIPEKPLFKKVFHANLLTKTRFYTTINRYPHNSIPMYSQGTEREEAIFYLTCHSIVIFTMIAFGYSLFVLTGIAIR